MSGKLASRARHAWEAQRLRPITLHERYVKLLPQPGEDDAAARLDTYLARAVKAPEGGSST